MYKLYTMLVFVQATVLIACKNLGFGCKSGNALI